MKLQDPLAWIRLRNNLRCSQGLTALAKDVIRRAKNILLNTAALQKGGKIYSMQISDARQEYNTESTRGSQSAVVFLILNETFET